MKLHDGKTLEATEDSVKELRKQSSREGLGGVSARYRKRNIQCTRERQSESSINPFLVLNELEAGSKAIHW